MIRTRLTMDVCGKPWRITVFLPLTRYHVEEILDTLKSIEISEENLKTARENLTTGRVNNGFTFSNSEKRETVSVWAICTSPAMYFNLIVHELHHLSVHIADANQLDLREEDVCYINGDTAQHLWSLCDPLICPQR